MKISTLLLNSIIICSALLYTSCGSDKKVETTKNSPAYNMMATAQKPVAYISMNLVELIENSNFKDSKEIPLQIKMIANPQIDQHFNSKEQGFKVEGNIPFVVTAKENDEFNYAMGTTEVLDAKKVGSSLCTYFDGKVIEEEGLHILEASSPLLVGQHLTFVWNDKTLVMVFAKDLDTKSKAIDFIKQTKVDAPDNEKVLHFLAESNDFTALMFMDNYTNMVNHYSKTKLAPELLEVYKGMTTETKVNFDAGSFTFESDLEGDNFINSKFNPISEQPVDASFAHFLSENGQLILFSTASMNLNGMINSIEATQSEDKSIYEDKLNNIGITKDNVAELLNGQFSFSLMDVEDTPENVETPKVNGYAIENTFPRFLFTCGITDKEKVSQALEQREDISSLGNYYKLKDSYITVLENKLVASLSEDLIQKLANGETLPALDVNFETPLYGKPITNVDQLPERFKKVLMSNNGEKALKAYNTIEDIYFKADVRHSEFKVTLKDKNKNPLEVLTNLVVGYATSL